ncbi:MAG: redox-regulated ATPase YchF [Candidatus Blackburnbacteria bacterium]|nr:redox-regulated ATPase YchF [Candidatus Blackburnbacteria bacterium]
MSLKVGIVGLPNVGKSTLFNALLKKQAAYAANFPFATIEPNVGVVPVPDECLEKLANVVAVSEMGVILGSGSDTRIDSGQARMTDKRPPIVPATVEFVDIAGLVAGASKGEGLGNKFLAHIREVDAIVHVVRAFSDDNVIRAGSTDPKSDLEIVKTELDLADLETLEKSKIKNQKAKIQTKGENAPYLFKHKPFLIVLNVDEDQLKEALNLEEKFARELGLERDQVIAICAKTESELAGLGEDDTKLYLSDLGVEQSGLERLIKKAFATLGLITFLTAGTKEVRAWTIKKGTSAQNAAGEIHTDFITKFIKAEVVDFEDFVSCGGWKGSREKGKARLEGKDYVMRDGDVVEFRIGS